METIALHWTDHLLFVIIGVVIPLTAGRNSREQMKNLKFNSRLKQAVYFGNSLFLWALAGAALLVWWFNGRSWSDLGLVWPPPSWDQISIYIVVVFGLLYVIDTFTELMSGETQEETRQEMITELGFLPANAKEYSQFIVLALSAGICEEIVFRGYFLRYFQLLFGYDDPTYTVAILLSAIIFGLVHAYQGWRAMIKVTAMAVMFGFIFVRVESLFGLMVIHAVIDLLGGAVAWYLLRKK